jgi:hypothetical protein
MCHRLTEIGSRGLRGASMIGEHIKGVFKCDRHQ